MKTPRVFLSYSYQDQEKACLIADKLQELGVNVFHDQFGFDIGESFVNRLYKEIESSDFFLLLLSKNSIESRWVAKELDYAISKTLHFRDITIVPLLLSPAKIPNSLKDRVRFDLRRNFETQIKKLSEYLSLIPYVDFELLDPIKFEHLCIALLKKLRFKNFESENLDTYHYETLLSDFRADFIATLRYRDPFGGYVKVNWIFEFKYYKNSRADINALRQLSSYLEQLPVDFNGGLITNGILTSAAQEWLRENERRKRTNIRIIDGLKLKELILKHTDLVHEYFIGGGDHV